VWRREFDGRSEGLAVCTWGAFEPPLYAQLREMLGLAVFGAAGARRASMPSPGGR
jgi:hypothetical protein